MMTDVDNDTTTAAELAYNSIRRMLLQSKLQPGEQISQSRLAKIIGCSTVPVMEAMRRLETEGLFVKEPRRMARVRELSPADLEAFYLIREGLEPIAARRCAQRITDEQIKELCQLSDEYDSAAKENQYERCRDLEIEIHEFIADCADCPLLAEELNRLAVVRHTAGRALDEHLVPQTYPFQHRALVEAIKDRDEDMAEYLMRKHIRRGYENVRQQIEEHTKNMAAQKRRRKRKSSVQQREE